MPISRSPLVIASLLLLASPLYAGDWGQWRGPRRDGVSHETGLLQEWPAQGPKLVWQINTVGSGYSTPSIVGERIYVLGNEGNQNEFVLALKTSDGSKVWSRRLGNVGNPAQQPSYPAARSTPTVDGDLLFALGSDGDLVCLETASGNVKWTKSLRRDFGGVLGDWAYAESPLVDGDAVVCTPGGKTATMVSLNKKTGEVIWKCALPTADDAAYSSIVVAEIDGVRQYVQFVQKGLVGVEAATGKPLCEATETTAKGSQANIPTPVVSERLIYSAAGQSGGGLVKITGGPAAFKATQVYFSNKLPTAIGGSVLRGDELYGTNATTLICLDFNSGKEKWHNRSIGAAGIQYADGLLFLHGENGDVALVEASPDKYIEKGRFTPPNPPDRGQSKAWAYPVVSDGRLYIRDTGTLWCFDVKQ